MSALVQVVDTNDRPQRAASKQEIWEKGLLHRIVRIMVEHPDGRILLQLRSATKDIYPNCWDNSAAGHVDVGEDYETAAARELTEELGYTDLPLTRVGSYFKSSTWHGLKMNRFQRVYKVSTDQLPPRLEAGKIDDARWFTLQEIQQLIKKQPDHLTDGVKEVIQRYYLGQDSDDYEPVVIVDDRDQEIGEATLADARAYGIIYRVVFIMAKDAQGRILLQKRGPHLGLYPNCWDLAASGHVDGGRSYEEAGKRELAEEIGVQNAKMTELAHAYSDAPLWGNLVSRRFTKIFEVTLDPALPLHTDGREVVAVQWFTRQQIDELFTQTPELLAEGVHLARHEGLL